MEGVTGECDKGEKCGVDKVGACQRPLPGPCTLTHRCPIWYLTYRNTWSVHRVL